MSCWPRASPRPLGLTVPACDVIEVSAWLIANSPGMHIELARGQREPLRPACSSAAAYRRPHARPGRRLSARAAADDVRNLAEFAGMLALDKWTGNANGRQAVFDRNAPRAPLPRDFHRSGLLLQRRRLELPRLAPARRLRPQPRLSRRHRLAQFRALAHPRGRSGSAKKSGRSPRPSRRSGTRAMLPCSNNWSRSSSSGAHGCGNGSRNFGNPRVSPSRAGTRLPSAAFPGSSRLPGQPITFQKG